MKNYTEQELEFLIERFEKQQLPKEEWTHEAHLAVGVWYIMKNDFLKALDLVRNLIIKHNESVGTPNSETEGYHETITQFWLKNVVHFLKEHNFKTPVEACNALINSPDGHNHHILYFYSRDVLFSTKARHEYVEPDIKPIG